MGDDTESGLGQDQSLYREDTPEVASIRVLTETEVRFAWEFEVDIDRARTARVRMSYADYEHWGHGTTSPARVVEVAMTVLTRIRSRLLERDTFDLARARHEHPDFDELVSEFL